MESESSHLAVGFLLSGLVIRFLYFMKHILRKWYFWVITVFILLIAIGSSGQKKVEPIVETRQVQITGTVVENTQPEVTSAAEKTTSTQPVSVQPSTPSQGYKVTEVVDGDTIKVSINGSVETLRIIGLDTPETLDPRKPVQCFGKEASNKAKAFLTGKTVTLEADSTQGERDKYGRLLRYVFLDGVDYGKMMISEGYAHEYTYKLPYKYQTAYKAAQASAEANKFGFWSPNSCNGTTTTAASPTAPIAPVATTTANFYTSSYSTSKYYYPASCDGWKGLDAKYLKSFSTLDALLKAYPNRAASPQC
jgi:micrococcal nuclease